MRWREQARREIQQRLLKNLDRKFDPAEVAAHFENLPASYFDTMSEELIREHIAHRPQFPEVPDHATTTARCSRSIHWRHFPEQGHREVTIVSWDR